LQNDTQRLQRSSIHVITAYQTRLDRASVRLGALSPVGVLSRGYALVYAADGTLLRSVSEVSAGQTIRARLAVGALEAEVTQVNPRNATETSNS
jgi:exodeoxyribonuclease VII large subunit